jgi:hypothetical protein
MRRPALKGSRATPASTPALRQLPTTRSYCSRASSSRSRRWRCHAVKLLAWSKLVSSSVQIRSSMHRLWYNSYGAGWSAGSTAAVPVRPCRARMDLKQRLLGMQLRRAGFVRGRPIGAGDAGCHFATMNEEGRKAFSWECCVAVTWRKQGGSPGTA